MTINDYLIDAKRKLGLPSDYALAKKLHITKQSLSKMKRTGSISDDTAERLAEILNIEAAVIILTARAAKSHNKRFVASVRRLLQLAGSTGTTLALIAATLQMYIMLNGRRVNYSPSA